MKSKFSIFQYLCIHFIISASLFSQSGEKSLYVLPELSISQIEKGKIVIYDFEKDENRFLLSDSLLIADTSVYSYRVGLSDIKKISVNVGSFFLEGAGAGLVLGVLIGLATSTSNAEFKDVNFLLCVPLTLIFGIAGALVTDYDTIELKNSDLQGRHEKLRLFLEKNKKTGKPVESN